MQNQSESRVYAGFFTRLVAFGIDSLLATIVAAMVKSPFSAAALLGVDFFNKNFIFHYSFQDVLGYVGAAAYFVLLTYFTHTTPGKKAMRLEVITESGEWTMVNVLYRETIGRFLSSLLCVGYLAILVQEKKQGFHDMLCDTYVVYKDAILRKNEVSATPESMPMGSEPVGATPESMSMGSESVGMTPESMSSSNVVPAQPRNEGNMDVDNTESAHTYNEPYKEENAGSTSLYDTTVNAEQNVSSQENVAADISNTGTNEMM